jgi:hypothetical protein
MLGRFQHPRTTSARTSRRSLKELGLEDVAMKNLGVTVIAIAAVVLCIRLAHLVPGATDGGGTFTNDFWLNGFFMLLGFLVTTAAVSPVVATFLEWRSNHAWRAARLNVRDRFATSLGQVADSYGKFLVTVAGGDPHGLAATFLAQTHQGLVDFFDTYESEQSAFNAEMHSAASNLRQHLLPFKRGLESTSAMVGRLRSHRLYVRDRTLNDMRALFERLPLSPTSMLARNVYFAGHDEVYFDVRLDLHLGAGVISIHRFSAITQVTLETEWARFTKACPAGEWPVSRSALTLKISEDENTQARLHAVYARGVIKEKYLADLVVSPT